MRNSPGRAQPGRRRLERFASSIGHNDLLLGPQHLERSVTSREEVGVRIKQVLVISNFWNNHAARPETQPGANHRCLLITGER